MISKTKRIAFREREVSEDDNNPQVVVNIVNDNGGVLSTWR